MEKDDGVFKLFGEGGEFNNLINILLDYIGSDDADNTIKLINMLGLDDAITAINVFLTQQNIVVTLTKGITTKEFTDNLKTFFENPEITNLIKLNSRNILQPGDKDTIKRSLKLIIDTYYYDDPSNHDVSENQFINNLLADLQYTNLQTLYREA